MAWFTKNASSAMLCGLAALLLAPQASGQPPGQPAPDRTSATFGDWTLRCDRREDITPPQRFCELGTTIQKPGEANAQAQIALGRVTRGAPLMITAVLPPNIALRSKPKVIVAGEPPQSVELSWSRCIVGGCLADAAVSEPLLRKLRSPADSARLEYRDGTEREIGFAVPLTGFSQALDALAREEAKD